MPGRIYYNTIISVSIIFISVAISSCASGPYFRPPSGFVLNYNLHKKNLFLFTELQDKFAFDCIQLNEEEGVLYVKTGKSIIQKLEVGMEKLPKLLEENDLSKIDLDFIKKISYNRNKNLLYAVSNSNLYALDADSLKVSEKIAFSDDSIKRVAISGNGDNLLLGNINNLTLLNQETLKEISTIAIDLPIVDIVEQNHKAYALSRSNDNKICRLTALNIDDDGNLSITKEYLLSSSAHSNLDMSGDGKWLIIGGHPLTIIDIKSGVIKYEIPSIEAHFASSAKFSKDNKYIILSGYQPYINVLKFPELTPVFSTPFSERLDSYLAIPIFPQLAISDNFIYAIGAYGVTNAPSGDIITKHLTAINAVDHKKSFVSVSAAGTGYKKFWGPAIAILSAKFE